MSDELEECDELSLHPAWKQAIKDFQEAGFTYGAIVPHEWIDKALGVPAVGPEEKLTKKALERIQLQRLAMLTPFKAALLADHQMDLVTKPGVGYIVAMPQDQTKMALEDGIADIKRGIRRMGLRLANVNSAMLTAEQRRENADAMAHAASLRQMMRKQRQVGLVAKSDD